MDQLIPGLPNDVALDCLIRTHFTDFSSMSSVCHSWNNRIALPEFLRLRRNSGKSRVVVAMAQSDSLPSKNGAKSCNLPPAYRVTIFEPETGSWSELPQLPGNSNGLPMFCRMAEVGSELVVMGGWDPKTFMVSKFVYVYSFITAKWRRGADMPDSARSFFACTAAGGVVYVAGGHDDCKNALKTVLAYDVANDEWERLPDMASERDECYAVVHRGKLHVIGGYTSEMQGRFEKSSEVLDLVTKQWETVNADFLDVATCHKACTSNKSDMYTCHNGHVAVRDGQGKWKNVTKMPSGIGEVAYTAVLEDKKMVVIGISNGGDTSTGYVLNLKTLTWSQVCLPEKYSGNIHSGCCLTL